MNDKDTFNNLRMKLLGESKGLTQYEKIPNDFNEKFFKLIELAVFSLMHKENNFFGNCLIQMKREIKLDLPSAAGITSDLTYFIIYFNPLIVLRCSFEELKAEIKHQIYHIIFRHIERTRSIKYKHNNLAANIGMDIAVNQFIENLPEWEWTIEKAESEFNIELKRNMHYEYYCQHIQNALDRLELDVHNNKKELQHRKNNIKYMHDEGQCHDIWNNANIDMNLENIDELTRRMINNSYRGIIPLGLEEIIGKINKKAELKWQDILKRTMGTLPVPNKKTVMRRNRRQPNRLDLRGTLPRHIVKIVIAIDTSGSMRKEQFNKSMAEIFQIIKNYRFEVTIIECDCDIQKVYTVNSYRNIEYNIKGRGGTVFSPVFEYINQNRLQDSMLIYFTDGYGEEELKIKPRNFRTLWILTGANNNLSLKNPYGIVKTLK